MNPDDELKMTNNWTELKEPLSDKSIIVNSAKIKSK